MPLTPTERRRIRTILDTPAQTTLRNYHVVTFRKCDQHKAGDLTVDTTCGCSYITAKTADEARRISEDAKDVARMFAQDLAQTQARIKDDVLASMADQVVNFDTDARTYVPVETATGWGLREDAYGYIEAYRTEFTLRVAPVGERDLYAETAPDVSLRHANYSDTLIEAVSQMQRLPGGSYIYIDDAIALGITDHRGPVFHCKYCKAHGYRDNYIAPCNVGDELFIGDVMRHYYVCKKIATFKRVAQYKVDAQAFAFSTYGFGSPNRLAPEYRNIARDTEGNVLAVKVLL